VGGGGGGRGGGHRREETQIKTTTHMPGTQNQRSGFRGQCTRRNETSVDVGLMIWFEKVDANLVTQMSRKIVYVCAIFEQYIALLDLEEWSYI